VTNAGRLISGRGFDFKSKSAAISIGYTDLSREIFREKPNISAAPRSGSGDGLVRRHLADRCDAER
jgi:hypothetical protein